MRGFCITNVEWQEFWFAKTYRADTSPVQFVTTLNLLGLAVPGWATSCSDTRKRWPSRVTAKPRLRLAPGIEKFPRDTCSTVWSPALISIAVIPRPRPWLKNNSLPLALQVRFRAPAESSITNFPAFGEGND